MKKIYCVLMACFALFIISCGSSTNAPGDVVIKVYKGVAENNVDALVDNFYNDSEEFTEEDKALLVSLSEKGKAQFDEKGGLKDVEILEETISEDGTTAKVKMNVIYNDGTTEESSQPLKLDKNGNWKITF